MKNYFKALFLILFVSSCTPEEVTIVGTLSTPVQPAGSGEVAWITQSNSSVIQLVAVPFENFVFEGWLEGNQTTPTNKEASYFVQLDSSNKTITALFSLIDEDNDGVADANDLCPGTDPDSVVDGNGCAMEQKDADGDGVPDYKDLCPETPEGESADENGCADSQIIMVPDEEFERYLIRKGWDDEINGWTYNNKIKNLTYFYIDFRYDRYDILDFTGIEGFTSLTNFTLYYANDVVNIDLSKNETLTYFRLHGGANLMELELPESDVFEEFYLQMTASGGNLNHLDLSNNTSLKRIDIRGTDYNNISAITSLDLGNNKNLEILSLGRVFLNEPLDITKNTSIINLSYDNSGITELDVTQNTALKYLYLYRNNLTTIDVSNNRELEQLTLNNNSNLNSLDVSSNTKLRTLNLYQCDLSMLDVTNNRELDNLDVSFNRLTSLDVTQNTALRTLLIYSGGTYDFTNLDVTNNTQLQTLYFTNHNITSLDLSRNTELSHLDLSNNYNLTSLDLSENSNLNYFTFSRFQGTSIDLSNNTNLRSLTLYNSRITSLDLTNNINLVYLNLPYCYSLTSIDISTASELYTLYVNSSPLTSLDVSASNNLTTFYAQGIGTNCIKVSQEQLDVNQYRTDYYGNLYWRKSSGTSYNTECN